MNPILIEPPPVTLPDTTALPSPDWSRARALLLEEPRSVENGLLARAAAHIADGWRDLSGLGRQAEQALGAGVAEPIRAPLLAAAEEIEDLALTVANAVVSIGFGPESAECEDIIEDVEELALRLRLLSMALSAAPARPSFLAAVRAADARSDAWVRPLLMTLHAIAATRMVGTS